MLFCHTKTGYEMRLCKYISHLLWLSIYFEVPARKPPIPSAWPYARLFPGSIENYKPYIAIVQIPVTIRNYG